MEMATTDDRPPATDPRRDKKRSAPPQRIEARITSIPQSTFRTGLTASFGYAFAGLAYCFRTQRNFRIHIAIGLIVTLAGIALGLSWVEWAVVSILIVVVLAAEMVNTMVEALVDLVTEQYHPLAKVAKDVAAGIVLLSATGSTVVGLLIFLPKIVGLFGK
jgi:diacylglycerol kinase